MGCKNEKLDLQAALSAPETSAHAICLAVFLLSADFHDFEGCFFLQCHEN